GALVAPRPRAPAANAGDSEDEGHGAGREHRPAPIAVDESENPVGRHPFRCASRSAGRRVAKTPMIDRFWPIVALARSPRWMYKLAMHVVAVVALAGVVPFDLATPTEVF